MSAAAMLIRGDALRLSLRDESVDLIVTSPPYWHARDYDADGQLGHEPTMRGYIDALLVATSEMARVLKRDGSIFVNLGDRYVTSRRGPDASSSRLNSGAQQRPSLSPAPEGRRRKSLMMLPERYRIAVADELGLMVRQVLVWSKPNATPEPVRDRLRRTHEDVVHLVKHGRYYQAVDELRTPPARDWTGTSRDTLGGRGRDDHYGDGGGTVEPHPLGSLPGSVWTIPTQPLNVPDGYAEHYAAFPTELPRRLVLGFSPPGICTTCEQPLRLEVERRRHREGKGVEGAIWPDRLKRRSNHTRQRHLEQTDVTRLGYVCSCDGPPPLTRPAVVLDPFSGTGTTALVAQALGRHGVGVDLSASYCRLAGWRVHESGHGQKVAARTRGERQLELGAVPA